MSGCLLRIVDQYRDFSFVLFYLVTIHRNDGLRVNNARGTSLSGHAAALCCPMLLTLSLCVSALHKFTIDTNVDVLTTALKRQPWATSHKSS